MAWFFVPAIIVIALLVLWSRRYRRGYVGDEYIPRNVDPRNDPEIRRDGSTWY